MQSSIFNDLLAAGNHTVTFHNLIPIRSALPDDWYRPCSTISSPLDYLQPLPSPQTNDFHPYSTISSPCDNHNWTTDLVFAFFTTFSSTPDNHYWSNHLILISLPISGPISWSAPNERYYTHSTVSSLLNEWSYPHFTIYSPSDDLIRYTSRPHLVIVTQPISSLFHYLIPIWWSPFYSTHSPIVDHSWTNDLILIYYLIPM